MSRFKIFIFLLAVGIASSILASAYWYYTRVMGHEDLVQNQIQAMQGKKSALPDPGIRRFDDAVAMIKATNFEDGRKSLYQLLLSFPDTSKAAEARRIIGEMNMDMLFSKDDNVTGKDYIVQSGDSMTLIASKHKTTIECILRANGMLSDRLHPGDHLFVFPLEFELSVDVSAKTLSLFRTVAGTRYFFKEYHAVDLKVPPGMRVPAETTIRSKTAVLDGKTIAPTNAQFVAAEKTLVSLRAGFNIRGLPQAKPVAPKAVPAAVKPGSKAKSGAAETPASGAELLPAIPETGVFLAREDLEELYTIIRTGTKLIVVR